MNQRRAVLLAMLALAVLAFVGLPGRLGGSYAVLTETETLSGGVSSGQWLATITVTKLVDGDQTFAFTTGATPGCDEDTTLGNSESFSCTFDARGEAAYSISETATDGWAAPAIACTPSGSVQVPPATTDSYTISFDLAPGDDVTCTFTNTPATGDITIRKTASGGAGSTTFDFTTSIPGCEDVGITVAADGSNSHACEDKPATTYVIAEQPEEGWTLTDIQCAGEGSSFLYGSLGSQTHTAFQEGDTAVQVALGAGSSVTCDFTNTRDTGSVTVTKQADAAGSFDFDLSALTAAGATCTSASITVSSPDFEGSVTCLDVPTGPYTIAEEDPGAEWSFVSADCGDGASESPSVTLTVSKGETTTCSFVNQAVPAATEFIQTSQASACTVGGATGLTLGTATGTPATVTESGPPSTQEAFFTFTSESISLSTWAAGTYTVELNVTGKGGQVQGYHVEIFRVFSDCSTATLVGQSTAQEGTGLKTFTISAASSTGSASDRLQVRVVAEVGPGQSQGEPARQLEIQVNTTDSEVITPW